MTLRAAPLNFADRYRRPCEASEDHSPLCYCGGRRWVLDVPPGWRRLSPSQLRTLASCPRKYRLRYVDRVQQPVTPLALVMGSVWQAAVAESDPGLCEDLLDELTYQRVLTDAEAAWLLAWLPRSVDAYLSTHPVEGNTEVVFCGPVVWPEGGRPGLLLEAHADEHRPDHRAVVENKLVGAVRSVDLVHDLQLLALRAAAGACGHPVEVLIYRQARRPRTPKEITPEEVRKAEKWQPSVEETQVRVDPQGVELMEFRAGVAQWVRQLDEHRRTGLWPRNWSACDQMGECEFKAVCLSTGEV